MSDLSNGSFPIEGKVLFVGKDQQVSDKLTKRVLWVEAFGDTNYPQILEVEFINDKTSIIGKYAPGDYVAVDINLRGRRVQMTDGSERVFNSLNGWRIKGNASGSDDTPAAAPAAASTPTPATSDVKDDLPF